jgi:hypothetical protein
MYSIQSHLKLQSFEFSKHTNDCSFNSCIDEDQIIGLLIDKYGDRIRKPKARMWYDLLALDYTRGWIPINIKTTTTLTSNTKQAK